MELINVPNLLTLFRLFISPLAGFEIYRGNYDWGIFLYLTAAVTDFLDGYIARKTNSETHLGVILDPIADKVLILSYLVPLFVGDFRYKPAAVVVFAFLLKELVVILGIPIAVKRGINPKPNIFGKLSTTLLLLYGGVLLLENRFGVELLTIQRLLECAASASLLITAYTYMLRVLGKENPLRGIFFTLPFPHRR